MERYTYFDGGKWRLKIGDTEYSGKAVDRLAAYEDTELEPKEVLPKEYAGEIMKSMILLKEYQKLGPIDRLRELKQADDEGKCVVLPCKIGDTLYEIIRYRNSGTVEIVERTALSVEKFQDDGYIKMQRWVPCYDTAGILKQRVDSWAKIEDFGKAVFLTRKDAEAALRREQDG